MKRNTLILLTGLLALTGCATSSKIVVPSYTAPAEVQKLEELKSGGETPEGVYLTFAINPELRFVSRPSRSEAELLTRNLINQVQAQLTEVSFITIHPIYDLSSVVLDMEVLDYQYQANGNERKGKLQVAFTLSKGGTPVMTKIYDANEIRFSNDPNRLPSRQDLLARMAQTVVKKFITDISPTRTNQLREFLPLPTALSHVKGFAERGNFESAIEDMLAFKGQRDVNFFYNLAVLYEALGSRSENLQISAKAKLAYDEAFRLGGNQNQVVADAKARFDNFYRLLLLTQSQQERNQQLNQDLNQLFSIQ